MKTITFFVLGLILLAGCGKSHNHEHHHHAHKAPNGGTMVELDHDRCHLEFFKDDNNASRMIAVAHTFHPSHQLVKLSMTDFTVIAKVDGREKALLFRPVVDSLAGNSTTNSSRFATGAEWLASTSSFKARVVKVEFPGGSAANKTFQFGKKD